MLRRLHNNIFALKLKEVFESPLVLVYQTLGHVDHLDVKQQLRAGLAKEPAAQQAHVAMCHMKNTVAAATGDDTLTRLFNNSNLLVGFQLPQQQAAVVHQQQQQHDQQQQDQQQQQLQGLLMAAAMQKVRQDMSPQQILGGLLQQPLAGPHVPQPALRAFVETGAQLPSEQPVVLIGAFYKRAATPIAHLRKWIKLDQTQVYGELLGVLESPMTELLAFEGCAEELLASLDDVAGADVTQLLDYRAATAPMQPQEA